MASSQQSGDIFIGPLSLSFSASSPSLCASIKANDPIMTVSTRSSHVACHAVMVVAIDFDGTLYNAATQSLCQHSTAELRRLGAPLSGATMWSRRVVRVIATGRPMVSLLRVTARETLPLDVAVPVDYVVVGSGSTIARWPSLEVVKQHVLDSRVAFLVASFLIRRGLSFFAIRPHPHSHRSFFHRRRIPCPEAAAGGVDDFDARLALYPDSDDMTLDGAWMDRHRRYATTSTTGHRPADNNLSDDDSVVQFLVTDLVGISGPLTVTETPPAADSAADSVVPAGGRAGTVEELRDALRGECAEQLGNASALHVVRTTSPLNGRRTWAEIFPASVSKSAAVAELAEMHGVSQHDTVAIGNDFNDLDMLRWAGKGCVVANAPHELRREFESSHATCGEGGVAELLRRHCYGKPSDGKE